HFTLEQEPEFDVDAIPEASDEDTEE
ncbi:hypothetical protein ACFMKD_14440, partial [Acinetobacter baumannii]